MKLMYLKNQTSILIDYVGFKVSVFFKYQNEDLVYLLLYVKNGCNSM